jgi:hypothetical protein
MICGSRLVTGPGAHNQSCGTKVGASFVLMHRGPETMASLTFSRVCIYTGFLWVQIVTEPPLDSPICLR